MLFSDGHDGGGAAVVRSEERGVGHLVDTLVVTVGDQPAPLWASIRYWRPRLVVLVTSDRDEESHRSGTRAVADRLRAVLRGDPDLERIEARCVSIGGRPHSIPEVQRRWAADVGPALRTEAWALDTTGGTPAMAVVAALAHDSAGLGSALRSWVTDDGLHLESGTIVDVARPSISTLLQLHGFGAHALERPGQAHDMSTDNHGPQYEGSAALAVQDILDEDGTPYFDEVYAGTKVYPVGSQPHSWSDIDILARRGALVAALEVKSSRHQKDVLRPLGWHTAVARLAFGNHTITGWVLAHGDSTHLASFEKETAHGPIRTSVFPLPAEAGILDEDARSAFQHKLKTLCDERLDQRHLTQPTALRPADAPRRSTVTAHGDPSRSRVLVATASPNPGTVRSALAASPAVTDVIVIRTAEAAQRWDAANAPRWGRALRVHHVDIEGDVATAGDLEGALDRATRIDERVHADVTGGLKLNAYRLAVEAARRGIPVTLSSLATGSITSTTGWASEIATSVELPGYTRTRLDRMDSHPHWRRLIEEARSTTSRDPGAGRRMEAIKSVIDALDLPGGAMIHLRDPRDSVWRLAPPVVVEKGWARIALCYPQSDAASAMERSDTYRDLAFWARARLHGPLQGSVRFLLLPSASTVRVKVKRRDGTTTERTQREAAQQQYETKIAPVPELADIYAVYDWQGGDRTGLRRALAKWGVEL